MGPGAPGKDETARGIHVESVTSGRHGRALRVAVVGDVEVQHMPTARPRSRQLEQQVKTAGNEPSNSEAREMGEAELITCSPGWPGADKMMFAPWPFQEVVELPGASGRAGSACAEWGCRRLLRLRGASPSKTDAPQSVGLGSFPNRCWGRH